MRHFFLYLKWNDWSIEQWKFMASIMYKNVFIFQSNSMASNWSINDMLFVMKFIQLFCLIKHMWEKKYGIFWFIYSYYRGWWLIFHIFFHPNEPTIHYPYSIYTVEHSHNNHMWLFQLVIIWPQLIEIEKTDNLLWIGTIVSANVF